MEDTAERAVLSRAAPRNPIEAAITCRQLCSVGDGCPVNGVMRNFSILGSYIEAADKYHSGTILMVRTLSYPTMSSSITGEERPRSICLAEVKWWQEMADEKATRFGMGLRYLE
jgi:hypothetical protein